jgi:GTP cyclohydrolase I
VTLEVESREVIEPEALIRLAEDQASCELYGVLKRVDEKYVTERAYDNPKFVEDLIRDVAARLSADERISRYVVEVENFESIHNHSAYARIESA